ncbi:MAG: hypothetical protein LBM65_01315 [Oscillospiraceae bacterium]|jgi:hypothetical protein|nr:hypothetical protein [Oscillospiraceae bacterium]
MENKKKLSKKVIAVIVLVSICVISTFSGLALVAGGAANFIADWNRWSSSFYSNQNREFSLNISEEGTVRLTNVDCKTVIETQDASPDSIIINYSGAAPDGIYGAAEVSIESSNYHGANISIEKTKFLKYLGIPNMAVLTVKVPNTFAGDIVINNSAGEFSIFEEKQPIGTEPFGLSVYNFAGDINCKGSFRSLQIDNFMGKCKAETTYEIGSLSVQNAFGDFDISIPAKTKANIYSNWDMPDGEGAVELHNKEAVKLEETITEYSDTYYLLNGGSEANINIWSIVGKFDLRFVE